MTDLKEIKMVARPWKPQDLIDDLQEMIDEEPDNYLNTQKTTLCMARDYLKEHFAGPKWIPVTERKSDVDILVLCIGKKGGMFLGILSQWDNCANGSCYCFVPNSRNGRYATHWMPLPEPPKEVDNG